MQVTKSTEVKVGIVSVLSLIILIVGIVLVKGVSVSNENEIRLRFLNSGGIKPSSPVVVNGVKKGTVKEIKSENNTVLIIATLDNIDDLNTFINQNKSELTNTIQNLNILAKDLKVAVQKNEPKVSSLLDSIDVTVNKANKLISNLDLVNEDANKLITNVNSIVTDIKSNKSILNKIAYDKQFANDLDSAINSISKLVDFINQNGVNVNVRLGTRP